MMITTLHIVRYWCRVFAALVVLVLNAGCNKETKSARADLSRVPRKAVPEPFRGDFTWTQVSDSAGNDQYGGAYAAISAGTSAHLNQDGTGTWVFRYDITYADGAHKCFHIDSDVTYEVTRLDDSHVTIVVHFISGKNYEDDQFLHKLDASRLYPYGDLVYENIEYAKNANGKLYFKAGPEVTFTKK
jgi:hypothetical protein